MSDVDTTNKHLVAAQGDNIVFLKPLIRVSKDDALNLAAYILALSEKSVEEFQEVYEAICNE